MICSKHSLTLTEPSVAELNQRIRVEVLDLISIGAITIPTDIDSLLMLRERMIIKQLNQALDIVGRNTATLPHPSLFKALCRNIPKNALADFHTYGTYLSEYKLINLVATIETFRCFLEKEALLLVKQRAKSISPDFIQALMELTNLQRTNLLIRLHISAETTSNTHLKRSSDKHRYRPMRDNNTQTSPLYSNSWGNAEDLSIGIPPDMQSQTKNVLNVKRCIFFKPSQPIPIPSVNSYHGKFYSSFQQDYRLEQERTNDIGASVSTSSDQNSLSFSIIFP